ncbi:MAG: hypothetical protein ACTSO9_05020 [Candidatus Helarchaeota archaeon]
MSKEVKVREWNKEDGSILHKCLVYPDQLILTIHVGNTPGDGYMYSQKEYLKGEGRAKLDHIRVKNWFSEEILHEILDFVRSS